jgi:hypothetical protein
VEVPSLRESLSCVHGRLSYSRADPDRRLFSFDFVTHQTPLCCVVWGRFVSIYRRGFKDKVWDKFWHWHQRCEAYPSSNCIIKKDKPSDDELCSRCQILSREDG